jgi:hypothetical protein
MFTPERTLTRIRRLWQHWAILGLLASPLTVWLPTTWFGPVWLWSILLPGVCALFGRILESRPTPTDRTRRRPPSARRVRLRRRPLEAPKPPVRRRVGLPVDRAFG